LGIELVDFGLLCNEAVWGAAAFNGAEKPVYLLVEEALELVTGSVGMVLVANAFGHLFS
jgi:hypothetical protein